MCLYPKLIKNRKYTITKKNGGNVPAVPDERVKYVPIGCQNCIECRKRKSREWQARILEDIKSNTNGKFITLTFSNEGLAEIINYINQKTKEKKLPITEGYLLDNQIATVATRLFLERWRKDHKQSLRHWLVTEIGHQGTENIHLHGIIWTNEPLDKIETYWKYGYMWKGKQYRGKTINYVNERTVGYICKYVTKIDLKHKEFKPIILTSPGIGKQFKNNYDSKHNKFNDENTKQFYRTRTGHKISLPIYWRNHLYTETQRETLWLHQLNKQTRYVMKRPIDVSKNFKEYNLAIITARHLNRELGYGGEETTEEEKAYAHQLRQIQTQTRLIKNNKNKKHDDETEYLYLHKIPDKKTNRQHIKGCP